MCFFKQERPLTTPHSLPPPHTRAQKLQTPPQLGFGFDGDLGVLRRSWPHIQAFKGLRGLVEVGDLGLPPSHPSAGGGRRHEEEDGLAM